MILEKYSFGLGDRFRHQGHAQLQAVIEAGCDAVNITPVWSKSHREHTIVKTDPADVRHEADDAVDALAWNSPYFVDADHVGLENVDLFVEACDFFTIDVSDVIGRPADSDDSVVGTYVPLTIPNGKTVYIG
jgi:tagaturonate epimerase